MVKDREILSTEEQLGLSKEQIQQLKDKSLSKAGRIEVAVLLLNETYTFKEVLEQLDAGKTVKELTKQEAKLNKNRVTFIVLSFTIDSYVININD